MAGGVYHSNQYSQKIEILLCTSGGGIGCGARVVGIGNVNSVIYAKTGLSRTSKYYLGG